VEICTNSKHYTEATPYSSGNNTPVWSSRTQNGWMLNYTEATRDVSGHDYISWQDPTTIRYRFCITTFRRYQNYENEDWIFIAFANEIFWERTHGVSAVQLKTFVQLRQEEMEVAVEDEKSRQHIMWKRLQMEEQEEKDDPVRTVAVIIQ